MNSYKDYEKQVYNWLMTKHNHNKNFTFSVRQKANKGAELNYFIGTEKSSYFSTTFWFIPVAYPGSSSDLINLVFKINKNEITYHIQFNQTKNPENKQNQLALDLIKNIRLKLESFGDRFSRSEDAHKMEFSQVSSNKQYINFESMVFDLEDDLDKIIPIVDAEIQNSKVKDNSFIAHRFSTEEQNKMFKKMEERFKNYKNHDVVFDLIDDTIEEIVGITSIELKHQPLNQILYGPPGTGKTYNTVLEAAKIVAGNENISYSDALQVFNENLNNQIEFITFHQNYSYEDFIQGIRPDTENGKELSFEKKDGVFKRIADRAYKNLEASKNPATAKKEFDIVLQELIKPLNDLDVVELEIKMKKSSFYLTEIGEKSIEFRKNIGESQHTLSINTLRKMYEKGVNDIILGGLQPYYNPILALLLEKGKSQLVAVERKNYIIIIDEINRANISRVFGELITLIEEDKRSDGKIPLRVTLPSGDSFIVPSNLYIIGTMNTADKSIALLDIALRRRFDFIPMYPLYDGLEEKIYDTNKLQNINEAILIRKSHDFTIGHAYFMGDGYTLENTINKKVIPLLLEYFMNDEKEVTAILQAAAITIGGWPLKMLS
ncbi:MULTISPECIES: McrB family protein [Flavobacterium]|uniref:AAA family ATPase n=1 Tax=Flavobacterium algoritolerans TaxID=3041254 RepID=A0ABT6VAT7_9FLAO|nr:AAA family ATPase [Flavobacterium algoritolerans]MDI5895351.1 AAA family ATPase [Flavobacterium algoritolerans]